MLSLDASLLGALNFVLASSHYTGEPIYFGKMHAISRYLSVQMIVCRSVPENLGGTIMTQVPILANQRASMRYH